MRMMQISVKTLDSQTKVFTVPDECTVKEFKEHISSDVNIPPEKQRLIFKGKVLQDDKKLSEYGADGCVIHLVERKPTVPGSQDGANGSSSTSTSSSTPGAPSFGLGPNIVMGAFSMPVDVVGATQQIVQSLVNQLGVDSAQANISTTSSDDGSSVNVHINLQATTQPGNDVSQRINRARHFMRAASSCLNRTEGEGVLPMDTSETPSTENTNQAQGTSTEAASQTSSLASPAALAQILREASDSMTSMQTLLGRYASLLDTNRPEDLGPSEDTLPDRVAESFHNLSHAYHALSDLTFNFRGPEPRRPSVLTSLSPHMPSVPMLSSFVGAPQMIRTQQPQQPPASSTVPQTSQSAQPTPGTPQLPLGTNQNLRIHVNPQGGISFTTIISNVSQSGTAAASSVNSQSTPSTTSTSGTRMSASADNGAARETFSSSFGEQRSSVGTNTNGSSTSTSTQTSQPGVRTRIIVDDFIALISNVPASMAAAAAAAQGQVPPGMTGAQNPGTQGQGAATATATASTTSQPQSQAQTQSVPTPAAQSATTGQEQARPQGLPAGLSMNLLSGLPTANSNHPDPSLPCQSFHFGPQGQRAQPQQTSQQSTQTTTSTTNTTSTQAETPVTSTPQSQAQAREGSEQTANPVNPPPARERPRPPPDQRARARERTISPAELQGILGMMAYDQRTGGTRGLSSYFPAGFNPRGSRQSSGPSDSRRSMMDFLDTIMSDVHSHSEGGQTQTINSLIQTMRASGLDIQDEEGLIASLYQRLSAVMTMEDVMEVVMGLESPFDRIQPALMLYVNEDLLRGKEATHQNINEAAKELSKEIVDGVADSLRVASTNDNIDIVESAQSFLEHYIGTAISLVLHSEREPRFAEYFQGHMKDIAAEFFTMLVFSYRDGMDGVERVIRNRLPQSSLTADMSEQSREMFVQLLLRNIRQMYYSRAYCEPRLQRFMIRAKPPQPPSQSQAASQPKASTEPQAPSRPATEESIAADGQGVDDEMDSPDSDDSETFTTPPGSVTAGIDSDRLQTECPDGVEAMEDEDKDDEWKSIMPEEWIPVITTDIVRQRRMPPQAPFSDAYINGLPPKRRKMVDQRGITPSEDSIGDALKHAAAATGATPLTSLEDLSKAAKGNRKLHGAYRREIKKEVKTRLEKDTDYRPNKFPQTRDYFDKDTQRK